MYYFCSKDEDEVDDTLAMDEDDSVLEGSVTESSLLDSSDAGISTPKEEETKISKVYLSEVFSRQ